jgi:PAS domain S-box-containing protein
MDGEPMMRIVVFACVGLGLALIGLMFQASGNNAFFARHTPWLYGLGIALVAGLLVLIGFQIVLLARKLRHRVFGAKLALRLMMLSALMAVIPGTLVYGISVQFINRSIDSWFDVPVDKAMDGALNLAKGALEASLVDLTRKAREAAYRISESSIPEDAALREARSRLGLEEAALFAADGKLIAFSGAGARLFPDKPNTEDIKEALRRNMVRAVESVAGKDTAGALYLRVAVSVAPRSAFEAPMVLHAVSSAPSALAADAQAVERGRSDYQQLAIQRQGLKRLFALTLTLAMLLTLFSAISLAFVLSERLSAPLSALAESTRAIAKGDFTKLNPVTSRDEFGVLTQSFNTMTRQLAEASEAVSKKQTELEAGKTYLESILGNLTSGVITLDADHAVRTANLAAHTMLGVKAAAFAGLRIRDWPASSSALAALSSAIAQELSVRDRLWQREVTFDDDTSGATRTLLVRGTVLPESTGGGFVIVLDDISKLIRAQREAAWGEVARRLAHEIKNPLTPIQLSAERLERKLEAKLDPADRDILVRSTGTIVAQVGALKSMVDDFGVYSMSARPRPRAPLDLNALIAEVLVLYESSGVTLRCDFDITLPRVMGDAPSLRQVVHNLVRNALDAVAGMERPQIELKTIEREGAAVFTVHDNGAGVRDDILKRVFEPYVTSKVKGTGLGLAIVKKIIEDHGGEVRLDNAGKDGGATAHIVLPAATSPETAAPPDETQKND